MLTIQDLHYHIGDRDLLDGIDWQITPGNRTALVGPNGIGKTTLLKILNGDLEYHSGHISKSKDYLIGYLPQEEIAVPGTSILQTVLDGQKEIKLLEHRINELHQNLELNPENREQLLEQLGTLEHRFSALNGYHLETTARNILCGLGFKKDEFSRSLTELSGGWRMRVYLALLLVLNPDLLLLDEPTNHLDLPSLEWLEQYLLNYTGSIIMVSHDRFFIDRLATQITELSRGKLVFYPGNYHKYEEKKEQNESLLLKKWKEQKTERERQERFINKFRYQATKAKQVQSRIRQLEKMEELNDLPEITPPPPRIDFTLSVPFTSYNDVLTIKDLKFKYDQDWVLDDITLNIYRGEKVALVGKNGAGKTTLTRLIVDQLQPALGMMRLGERTVIGYYAQHQVDILNLEATVYDEVVSTVATSLVPRVRDVLGLFQLHGDDVFKKICVLSGGEKARVSLAKILLSPVNFLIMDEPTNHLDKNAKESLERALSNYEGTLLLISHDRYFLDKLVHRVLEIRDHQLWDFDGNYSYYLQKRDSILLSSSGSISKTQTLPLPGPTIETDKSSSMAGKKTKEQKRLEAEARQAVSKDRNRLQKTVNSLEEKIEKLENNKKTLEQQMAEPKTYENSELAIKLQKEYAATVKDLGLLSSQWESALTELEVIKESLL